MNDNDKCQIADKESKRTKERINENPASSIYGNLYNKPTGDLRSGR